MQYYFKWFHSIKSGEEAGFSKQGAAFIADRMRYAQYIHLQIILAGSTKYENKRQWNC